MAARLPNNASDDGLTIMFEHCTARSHYSDMSSTWSSPTPSSAPHTPTEQPSSYPLEDASEDSWNLIPYDVPWGTEYYDYQTGTLPGPDGACLFLRSPTPLKNRRTQKACNKCRQRKAKCSGTHPTCSRCLARGYICEYVEEPKRSSHKAGRAHPRDARVQREPSEDPSDEAEDSSTDGDSPSPRDVQTFAPRPLKVEEPELSTPDLIYPDSADTSDTASSTAEYCSPWEDTSYQCEAPYGYNSPAQSFGEHRMGNYYDESPSYAADADMPQYQAHNTYFAQGSSQHPAAAVHAPRPVRCTGSPSFLSPQAQHTMVASSCEAHMFPHDDMLIHMSPAAEPVSQIAIPQLPSIPSVELAAVHNGALEYAPHPHEMYYYQAPMPQYPFLQYQYAAPAYGVPVLQDNVEPTMLYTMVPAGMAS